MQGIPTITARTWPSSAGRARELLRPVGLALAILAIELVLAHSATSPQLPKLVLLFFGVFIVALILRFPFATALVLIGLTDSVFGDSFFAHQVGPVTVRPYELALFCLLALSVLRPVKRTWGGSTGAALAIFLALVVVSAAIAVSAGRAELTEAFNWARPLALLTIFYVVIRLFPEPEQQRSLLLGAAVIAAATGAIALLAFLGAGFTHSLQESGEQAIRSEEGLGSLSRVRLPGLGAGYALFWYAAVQIMSRRGRQRLLWSGLLLGIGVDILVSFNRNMWVGIVVGLFLMTILGGPFVRNRIAGSVAMVVAGLVAVIVFSSSASSDQVIAPVLRRGETILNPSKTAGENSLQDRAKETRIAWKTARENPLLGVGAGASFGVISKHPVTSGSIFVGVATEPQLFLHNQYIYLILIAGVPGLIAFLWFLLSSVAFALRRSPRDLAILACGVGITLIMISSVVAIYFTVENMTTMLGLLCGVIVTDRVRLASGQASSGLLPE